MKLENVILKLNKTAYIGWEEVSIKRSIEEGVSSFELVLADPDDDATDLLDIDPGDPVQVLYGKELLITGYIDEISVGGDATTHGYRIRGRSRTKDLVDCSSTETKQLKNQSLSQLSNTLAKEYGIKVIVRGSEGKPIKDFQVEQNGESPFSAIQRLAEREKLVITDTPEGDLLLTNIGNGDTKNELKHYPGENTGILEYERIRKEEGRYSKVVVKAQTKSDDNYYGKQNNQVLAERDDPDVRRNKVKIIIADSQMSQTEAQNRANWEAQSSAGKADTITYKVQGWFGSADELWRENQRVHVDDEYILAEDYYVIGSVEYSINDGGTTATLTLNPPEAFEKEPEDEKEKNTGKSKRKSKDKAVVRKKGKNKTNTKETINDEEWRHIEVNANK